MAVYRPNTYQVNTGSVVDRTQGLRQALGDVGNLYQGYLSDQEAKRARAVQENRQAEQDRMAQELHGARMGEIQEAQATKEFMRDYDPRIAIGGRGVEAPTQRAMAEEGGDVVQNLLSSRGIKSTADGEGIGLTEYMAQAPEDERQRLVSALGDVGSKGLGRLQETATQEPVRAQVFKDVLAQTGRADLAKQTADTYASDYATKRELAEQEKQATTQLNDQLGRRAENIKDAYDRRIKQAEFNRKVGTTLLDKYEKATGSGSKKDMVDVYQGLAELDIGWFDNKQSRSMIEAAEAEGFTPAEILSGMRNLYREGAIDDELAVDKPGEFVSALANQKAQGRLSSDLRSSLASLTAPTLSPQEERILAQATAGVQSRTGQELLTDRGRGAFGDRSQYLGNRLPGVSRPEQRAVAQPVNQVTSRVQETTPVQEPVVQEQQVPRVPITPEVQERIQYLEDQKDLLETYKEGATPEQVQNLDSAIDNIDRSVLQLYNPEEDLSGLRTPKVIGFDQGRLVDFLSMGNRARALEPRN